VNKTNNHTAELISAVDLDQALIEAAWASQADESLILGLLRQGASPFAMTLAGKTAAFGLMEKFAGEHQIIKEWALLANKAKPPDKFPNLIIGLLQKTHLGRSRWFMHEHLLECMRTCIKSGVFYENEHWQATGKGLWGLLFPDTEAIRDQWRWEAADILITAAPSLADENLPVNPQEKIGLSPFGGALQFAESQFVARKAILWPGADINIWKNGKTGADRNTLKLNLPRLLREAGRELLTAGLDIKGTDLNGNTLAHHIMMRPSILIGGAAGFAASELVLLLENGADLRARNNHGWGVLERIEGRGGTNKTEEPYSRQ
jgi:hypothetical protein